MPLDNTSFIFKFTLLALLSGITSAIIAYIFNDIFYEDWTIYFLFFGQGLIYSLFTLKIISSEYKGSHTKLIWFLCSSISYPVAMTAGVSETFGYIDYDPILWVVSIVGSLIVSVGYKIVVSKSNKTLPTINIIYVIIAGVFVVLVLEKIISVFENRTLLHSSIYIIWPTVVSFMLAFNTREKVIYL
ncbi:MAG: hypothetical protein R3B60_01880 [Candidatus Paceibacterota bacterium]